MTTADRVGLMSIRHRTRRRETQRNKLTSIGQYIEDLSLNFDPFNIPKIRFAHVTAVEAGRPLTLKVNDDGLIEAEIPYADPTPTPYLPAPPMSEEFMRAYFSAEDE